MGVLRVISKHGDDRLQWNEQDIQAGHIGAIAAIREAERIFTQERARGATAFRVETGKPTERIEQFDPQAGQIILTSSKIRSPLQAGQARMDRSSSSIMSWAPALTPG